MKTFDFNKVLKLFLPSLFFITISVIYAFDFSLITRNLIAGGIVLPIIINLFLQNKIFSRIIGSILLLGSSYMMLALFSDVVKEKADLGYLLLAFLILLSMAMSVLLIIGYGKPKQDKQ